MYIPVSVSSRLQSLRIPLFDGNSVALSPGLPLNVHIYLLMFILVEGLGLPLAVQVNVTEEPTEYCEFGMSGCFVTFGNLTLSIDEKKPNNVGFV